jgi:hypothetical protein
MPRRKRLRTWGRLRKGAQAVDVYSDGRAVFLYDESHTTTIRESGAFAEALSGPSAARSPALRALAQQGVLVVYEQPGDDGIRLEVALGAPLSEKEKGDLRWLPPQRARLWLPSGRLRVDSPNTLPGRDGEPRPGRIQVPPGDYRLVLHRLDVEATARLLNADVDGPLEVVTLTPLDRTGPAAAAAPLLLYEGSAESTWPGRYSVEGERFRGLALFNGADSQVVLNLDRAAAGRLGLRAGMGLSLQVEALDLSIEAFLIEEEARPDVMAMAPTTLAVVRAFGALPPRAKKEFPRDAAGGEWVRAADWFGAFRLRLPEAARQMEVLRFFRLGRGTPIPEPRQMEWLAVEARLRPRPGLPAAYLRAVGLG